MAKRPKAIASVGMELLDGDKFIKQLEKLTIEVQNAVVKEAVEAGTKPILAAMIANTPESNGSRALQSRKAKARWSGSKKLKTTIKAVVRNKRNRFGATSGAIGLVGPSYTDGGGHGNLFARDHKRKVLWGRDGGSVRSVNQFVKRTADQTAAAAKAVVTAKLKQGIDAAAARMSK
jgi:hypothetical protein